MGRLGCQDDDEGDRTVVYLAGADPLGALAHRAASPRQGDQRLHVAATCAQTRVIPPARRIVRPCATTPTQPHVKRTT